MRLALDLGHQRTQRPSHAGPGLGKVALGHASSCPTPPWVAKISAAKQGRCAEAVDVAERGLKRSWLGGPLRHSLIEVAGTCACRLKDEIKARHYFSLASPEFEDNIVRACTAVNIKLLE